nr:MAG TPA: major tail protein [Caudoviricetes sp.]
MTETLKSTVGAKINDVANILKGTTAQVYVKAKEGDARFLGWTKGVSFEEVVEKGSAMGDGALGTIAGTEYYTKLNAKIKGSLLEVDDKNYKDFFGLKEVSTSTTHGFQEADLTIKEYQRQPIITKDDTLEYLELRFLDLERNGLVLRLFNVSKSNAFKTSFGDKSELTVEFEVQGLYDPTKPTEVPWRLYTVKKNG